MRAACSSASTACSRLKIEDPFIDDTFINDKYNFFYIKPHVVLVHLPSRLRISMDVFAAFVLDVVKNVTKQKITFGAKLQV